MTLIKRYILSEFLRSSLAILAGMIVFFLCVAFLKEADDFIKYKATFLQIFRYYLYIVPGMVTQSLPFAALLGALLSLGGLSRSNEITAMRAGGISFADIMTPVLIGGLLLSVLGFFNNEVIMPRYAAQALRIIRVDVMKKEQRAVFQQRRLWLRGPDNSIVNIDLVTPDRTAMIGVTIYKLNPDFSLRERITAERLAWEEGAWRLKGGRKYVMTDDAVVSRPADNEIFNIVEKPDDMGMIAKDAEEMDLQELYDYVARLRNSGYQAVRYEVDLHTKIAYPFASFLMVLIAVPFSLQHTRSGGAAKGVAIAVLIAAVYWVLLSVGKALGRSGALPPFPAAWIANAFIGSGAFLMLHRLNKRM